MKFNFLPRFMREPSATEAIAELGKDVKSILGKAEAAEKAAHLAETSTQNLAKELVQLNSDNAEYRKWRGEMDERIKDGQKNMDELNTQLKLLRTGGITLNSAAATGDFNTALSKSIGENFEKVKASAYGAKYAMDLPKGTHLHQVKAAGNMTTATNLTGDPNITYIPTPVILPRQLVNFRDLVPGFQSATGLIVLFRENVVGGNPNTTPQQGAFGTQLTQGALKEQVGYTFTDVQFTANYMAGFVRVSKQMLQDLLFLQTYLPQMLIRDYYKYENSQFQTVQANNSLGDTTTSGGNDAEKFIDYITNLEATNFAPNGIVTTPGIWGKLMKTTVPSIGTSYSVPGGFYINPMTGYIEIAGTPVLKATWMPSGSAFIADWTQSQVATVDGLKVEFFEQDSDNVQRNLITVRVEARVTLVTAQPYGFTYATGL
jgi:HK97 family phage major capsid protein